MEFNKNYVSSRREEETGSGNTRMLRGGLEITLIPFVKLINTCISVILNYQEGEKRLRFTRKVGSCVNRYQVAVGVKISPIQSAPSGFRAQRLHQQLAADVVNKPCRQFTNLVFFSLSPVNNFPELKISLVIEVKLV